MKIFIVGDCGPEHNSIKSVHKTYKGAFKAWNDLRLYLLQQVQHFSKNDKEDKEMWEKIIKNLSCEDPEKIDNYPHETPYISEYEVKD